MGVLRRSAVRFVWATLVCAVTLVVSASACTSGPIADEVTPVRGVTEVRVTSEYSPAVIEVPVGTAVTWVFDDGRDKHDVVGVGWESPKLTEERWSYTFTGAGRFDYLCSLHPGMRGRVVVTSP